MEQEESFNPDDINDRDIVELEGKRYRKEYVPGYTFRTYYSHETEGKGPGPGWDFRFSLLDEKVAKSRHGRTFTEDEVIDPTKMPDEPFYRLVELD